MASKKPQNIYERVMEAIIQFECETGVKPTTLYLGQVEYEEAASHIRIASNGKLTIKEYFALPFFVVNTKYHLAVGWEDA